MIFGLHFQYSMPRAIEIQCANETMLCGASVTYSTSYFHQSSLFMGVRMLMVMLLLRLVLTFSMFEESLEHRENPFRIETHLWPKLC